METRFTSVPIAGCLKHGILENNRPKELGYFIAKTQNPLKHLVNKFDSLYDKKQEIIIYIIDENACSLKRVKRNQSGVICYCLNNFNKAREKVNKNWIEKDCLETCEHRQAKGNQKPMCQQELTLKFLLPNISNDRVWIFQTRSYYTIQNIYSYINFQKALGNSIKGYYKLFLSKKISEKDGKTFNNYVVDITKIEETKMQPVNVNPNNGISEENTLDTTNPNDTNNTEVSNLDTTNTEKKTTVKKQKSRKKQASNISPPENTNVIPIADDNIEATPENMEKYYILLETEKIDLKKNGKLVPYTKGKFINKDSKEFEIILHPNFANEIEKCALGSQFLLNTKEICGRLFATECQVLQKQLKEAV